ncbi:hypothetical protein [Peribacillus simplex]|nr:hypothetical protein [Peribacillus simplex]WHY99385.1 hypothetical protein QNH37_09645 [Peribacillus simplex]
MLKLWKSVIESLEVLDKAYHIAEKKRELSYVEMFKKIAAK